MSQQNEKVNIDRLARRVGKYALVVAVSQRARELKDRHARLGDLNPSNLVGRALDEIYEGQVKMLAEENEE